MNVLVYSGPEILPTSLNHTLASLRYILVPNYTVQSISQHALTTQPWQSSCALLVLPRSREHFVSSASKQIKAFVEDGGACLILGTDATAMPRSQAGFALGATSLSLGLEAGAVESPLKFYDKLSNCYITTDVEHRVEPRAIGLRSANGTEAKGIYDTEAAQFQGFSGVKDVSILAHGAEGSIAGLFLGVGKGHVAFWGPSIEYPLTEKPASSIVSALKIEDIISSDRARNKLLATTLSHLGLKVPPEEEHKHMIARPLPQFLTSAPTKPEIVEKILDDIAAPQSGAQLTMFKDANDEFYFHPLQESAELLETTRENAQTSSDPATWQPKHIVICRDGVLPAKNLTPLFDLNLFHNALANARQKQGVIAPSSAWGIGEAVLYGEAVTSTQTMLDKNPRLLTQLPVPLLSIASHQLTGRGRGSNVWLSPSGCLQFSLTLRVALDRFPAGKLVFVQYLFALAVAEACRSESVLGSSGAGEKVRIKWPNDLYAVTGPAKGDLRKIGGVLVNTSFSSGKVDIVIGCGLNVLNPPPITSLSQLQHGSRAELSLERTAAAIMTKFEQMWTVFVEGKGSFAPFIDLYLERWLHSDQAVTLTTTTPHTRVRITGITLDYGLLRTVPERSGMSAYPAKDDDYIDLQPDGNSFDLMTNLIRSKS
ncbi:class II aaRS and biotin synthetase [Pholiota conissans]|uniref:Class II aaRS and biotin synthetase n=1 Tax=Pholiota conissans TaxID=109636 RepID=A0A9P6CXX2_9AGAR|nr:class II aaRS and biotin synthetase [Pholiota conissans]